MQVQVGGEGINSISSAQPQFLKPDEGCDHTHLLFFSYSVENIICFGSLKWCYIYTSVLMMTLKFAVLSEIMVTCVVCPASGKQLKLFSVFNVPLQ